MHFALSVPGQVISSRSVILLNIPITMHPQRKFYSPLQPTPLYEMVRMPRATTEMNYCQMFHLAFKEKRKESVGQVLRRDIFHAFR